MRILTILSIAALLFAPPLSAETPDHVSPSRPRIGLVLGGGGAKGAAHLGVLRVLDEMHIPIDCVAGTSMGALVGATFAAGVPPKEIESQVLAVDWARTVGGTGGRDLMPIKRKLERKPTTNNFDLGIKNGGLQGSGGFINTQNIDELLRSLVAGARYVDDFDSLPIPFRAVATDMVSGDMVVLSQGDLSVAMRASMSVPGAFSPVVVGDLVLADGGQMRNVPVDIARQLCGDVIIAVSLATPQPTAADLSSSLALAARSLDVMIAANSRAQLATLTDRDVSIVVQMGDIGSGSFERVPDAIPLGREAALEKSEALARYSVSPEEYDAWRARINRNYHQPVQVAGVDVTGLERVNPEYVEQAIQATRAGSEVTPDAISADTSRIFALGDFSEVGYTMTDTTTSPRVEFHPIEKAWGPNYIDFDLGLSLADGDSTVFVLRAEHRRVWINSLGGEWHNIAQIGTDLELQTGLYQPLDAHQRYFVEPFLHVDRFYEDVYDRDEQVAKYNFTESYGQIDFGVNLGTHTQLRAGLRQSWNKVDLETGTPGLLPKYPSGQESDILLQAKYDTRNVVGLSSRGSLLVARHLSSGSWLGGEESYGMTEALAASVLPFGGDVISVFGAGGMNTGGQLPPYRRYRVGGIHSFPGLHRQQLRGDSYWLAGTGYRWKLADIQTVFDQALYAGLRLTMANVSGRIDDEDDELLAGIAVNLSGRTPIGPFIVSLATVDNDYWALQLALGAPIREGSIVDEIW